MLKLFLNKIFISILFLCLINIPTFACELDDMIGQMLVVGFRGDNVQSKQFKTIKKQIKNGDIGGVIFYEYNVSDSKNIKEMTESLNNIEAQYKPFITIDQEGGMVQILNSSNGFSDYLSAGDTKEKLNKNDALKMYNKLSSELYNSGFNLNYAPVVDLAINKDSAIQKKNRSYSVDPNVVADYAIQFIDANDKNGVVSVLKHFPGHGSASGDTHKGFVDGTQYWSENELIPYEKLINKSKLQMVMTSHVMLRQYDEKYPTSLSKNITQGLLRDKMGYQGVVITDDVDYMKAIKDNFSLNEVVINGINAGNDILLFSFYSKTDMKLPFKVRRIVKKAIKNGEISEDRIKESYNRIIKLKRELQIRRDEISQKNKNYDELINKYNGKTPIQWSENTAGVKKRIRTNKKILALTLDACGSKNDSLDEKLIDFLIENKIPATLFINGRWIKKYPERFKKLSSNPLFEIENHGIRHCPASINGKSIYNIEGTKNVSELIHEIDENGILIEKLTGRKPIFFRSGTAYYDEYAVKIANELGYQIIGFNVLGDRGATYTKEEVTKALLGAKRGDIIICHMNHPEKETGAGLINVLPMLIKKGYKFVKLEDYRNLLY